VEVERLQQEYDLEVEFAPFLLDPTTPPEGKPRRPMSHPDAPPSPLEERGERLGIRFSRGRTHTSNSHLALEAAEFAAENGLAWEFHKAMLRAYFEDLEDIGRVETVVAIGESAGLEGAMLREALEARRYRDLVDDGIAWSRSIGVTAIPTFIFAERLGIVGAQELDAFRETLARAGVQPRPPAGENG
jgi:predicted DsbA family dithiol-disulfide isomerase